MQNVGSRHCFLCVPLFVLAVQFFSGNRAFMQLFSVLQPLGQPHSISQSWPSVCCICVCRNSSQPVLGIFDMCTNVNGCTQVHKRVCAKSWCWEKISLPHRELEISTSNLVIQSLKKPEVLNSSLAFNSLNQNYYFLDASYLDTHTHSKWKKLFLQLPFEKKCGIFISIGDWCLLVWIHRQFW